MKGGNVRDVTKQVKVGTAIGRGLSLVHCVCGHDFTMDEGIVEPLALHARAEPQPCCGRRFVWSQAITVYEVT